MIFYIGFDCRVFFCDLVKFGFLIVVKYYLIDVVLINLCLLVVGFGCVEIDELCVVWWVVGV